MLGQLADLLFRWIHLIAGIMWIGNSMLWNWLDRNLDPGDPANPKHLGTIWMVHSGSFYEMRKLFLEPSQLPRRLFWFKWQSYTTWLTGILLLIVVYYTSSTGKSVLIGSVTVLGTFVLYDLLWRVVGKRNAVGVPLMLLVLGTAIYGLIHHLPGRVAYIHCGVLFGTIMSGNVLLHIIPSQRELVLATKEGRDQDPALSYRAKQRSIHNNYLTFPLLFTMFSNHFGFIYDHAHNGVLLAILFAGGAGARHFMNIRFTFRAWLPCFFGTIAATLIALAVVLAPPRADAKSPDAKKPVSFAEARKVINDRCLPCHSENPTDTSPPQPPPNVKFDTPDGIKQWAVRIQVRACAAKTMPFNNKTNITEAERDILQRWFDGGAPTE